MTRPYGKIPTLTSEFTAHAAGLLRRRYNASPNGGQCYATHTQLDSSLKFKDIRRIKREIYETFSECYVDWIERVNVPQMYGMYLLRKEEMQLVNRGADRVKEMLLYHVTTQSKALESLKSGLDWRRTQRAKYGCGVSFSDDAEYADKYAASSTEDKRVIMICSVLVKEMHEVNFRRNGRGDLIVPPGTADTTVSRDGCVYVKFNDFDFYPMYFVYYSYDDDDDDDDDDDYDYDYGSVTNYYNDYYYY